MLIPIALMFIAYFITNTVAKRYANIFILSLVVIFSLLVCLSLGLFYHVQFSPQDYREGSFRMIIGNGFWFSLLGAIYGAYKGRKKTLNKKETQNL